MLSYDDELDGIDLSDHPYYKRVSSPRCSRPSLLRIARRGGTSFLDYRGKGARMLRVFVLLSSAAVSSSRNSASAPAASA